MFDSLDEEDIPAMTILASKGALSSHLTVRSSYRLHVSSKCCITKKTVAPYLRIASLVREIPTVDEDISWW